MRVPLLIGLCVVLAASAALAGGTPNTGMGAKQMVFQFSGLSNLGLSPYEGGFGFRYFYADDTAIRGTLNFAYSKDDVTPTGGTKTEETYTRIGAMLVWEKYMAPIASVAPYMGIGAGYFYNKWEEPYTGSLADEEKVETTANDLMVALVGGFQWYFTDAISLGGEYRLAYTYSSGETKVAGDKVSENTSSMFGFDAASVFFSVHY
jgi:outer membrane protein W